MKKSNFKEIDTHMGLFDYTVSSIIGDEKNIEKYIQWKFCDKSFSHKVGEYRGICFHREGFVPIVWIPRKPKTSREYATLSHECLHAVFHMCDWAQLPRTKDNEEVITHSVAHLINSILSKI